MAKRFTDTEKWDRPWFRSLPNQYKLLWCFILDRCDMAGVWYVDIAAASFMIGSKIDRKKAEQLFEKQIETRADRWLIKDFISFQYGELNEANKVYRTVMSRLSLFKEGASIPLLSPIDGVKDKDKDKDGSVVRGVGGGIEIPLDLIENEAEIRDWLEYKRQRGQTYKPMGLAALWRAVRAIPKDKRRESVDHSMASNYTGLFEKKGGNFPGKDTRAEIDAEIARRRKMNELSKSIIER